MTADSAASYLSEQGDTVDYIAWRYYGRLDDRVVERVYEANSGLADLGPVLPDGTKVKLPRIPEPETREGVRLWS